MADRIVVMNDARIQQVADPLTIATRPETAVVARFMGDNNIIRGRVTEPRRRPARRRRTAPTSATSRRRARRLPRASATRRSSRSGRLRSRSTRAPGRLGRNSARLRDPLRRVPRRPRQAPPLGRAATGCSPRSPGDRYPALRGREGETDPDHAGRTRMSSSSVPESSRARPPARASRSSSSASGDARSDARPERARRRLGHRRSGRCPGGLWLAFYLLAPLVFIVLVSFWTYKLGAKSGFTTDWTLSNYGTIFHSSTYWHNMLSSLYTSLIAVAACLIFGFPIAYFLALKVQTPAQPDRALRDRARAVLDELPRPLGRLDIPAERRPRQVRRHDPVDAPRCAWR